jgi:hypothetical protein
MADDLSLAGRMTKLNVGPEGQLITDVPDRSLVGEECTLPCVQQNLSAA